MQLNALWTIEYATNHGDFGTGVAVLVDGHVYGGDTNYCYEGTYERQGEDLVACVKLCLHSGKRAAANNLAEEFSVLMRGRPVGEELEFTGVLEHEPDTKLFIHLQRRSGVPTAQEAGVPVSPRAMRSANAVADTAPGNEESAYLLEESTERLSLY